MLKKFKVNSIILKNLPFYTLYLIMMMLSIYKLKVDGSVISSIVLFIGSGLVTVVAFEVSFVFFFFVSSVFLAFISFEFYNTFGRNACADIIMLETLLYSLILFKRKVTKRDLIKTKKLEENKAALEKEVENQTVELETQTNRLKSQQDKIISIQNNTILGLSNLVENRDSDTGEHVRRTSAYVNLIARKAYMNGYYREILDEKYIEILTKAAPMHDIGKIVVPDAVLKKPGKLTDVEFAQIKMHTTEGGRIVREVLGEGEDENYINIATEVATSHHERWDGKGYPYGLKENEIPLSARIMAIADVFDALVSPRCYKEPFSTKRAFTIISQESGTHFDPILVNLFLDMQDDIVAVMEKYKD